MNFEVLKGHHVLVELWLLLLAIHNAYSKATVRILCEADTMQIEVLKSDNILDVYLEHMKDFPDPACKAEVKGTKATFRLSLSDIYKCGLTKVRNVNTGRTTYYHNVVLAYTNRKQVVLAKCHVGSNQTDGIVNVGEHKHLSVGTESNAIPSSFTESPDEIAGFVSPGGNGIPANLNYSDGEMRNRSRRDVLPAGFEEPEVIEITSEVTATAPEPVLGVSVRQNGKLIGDELSIKPGTPLQMEIFLDKLSSDTFGLLVSEMAVSDTRNLEEPIVLNGCSVDPYLFQNFVTIDGDFLTSKFRAFKFPESSYVLFKGTINVCLDKCRGIECSNGQIGYGRRRRSILPHDPNRVFEITMTTFMKMDMVTDGMTEHGILGNTIRANSSAFKRRGSSLIFTEEVVQEESLGGHPRGEVRRIDNNYHVPYRVYGDDNAATGAAAGTASSAHACNILLAFVFVTMVSFFFAT